MSDPSVQAMNQAQWYFEFHALQAKERAGLGLVASTFKSFFRALRETLVNVLGLNLFKTWRGVDQSTLSAEEKKVLDETTPYVPASFLFSKPEVLKAFLEEADRDEKTDAAMADAAFEAFSAKLARGDVGDIEPLFAATSNPNTYWQSEDTQAMLRALGVRQRAPNAPAVPHAKARPAKMGPGFKHLEVREVDDDG